MKAKWFVPALAVLLALPLAGTVSGARGRRGQRQGKAPRAHRLRAQLSPARGPLQPSAVGTLSYDNNVPFSRSGADDGTVGNLFVNGVLDPHSIAAVTFRLAGNYGSSSGANSVGIFMTLWDQNPGSFMLLQRGTVTGLPYIPYGGTGNVTMFTAMVSLPAPIVAHNGAFVGGLHQTYFDACAGNVALNSTCDGVALTMGGVDPGMGFHGIRVPFAVGMFTPAVNTVAGAGTNIAGVNAIFRVTGNNLPVELMNFGVE